MKSFKDQRGVGHVFLLTALVVVVVAGVVGYRVANNASTDTAAGTSVASHSTNPPDSIKSKADVKKAEQALDNTAIDGSVNPDQLDNDLNDLL